MAEQRRSGRSKGGIPHHPLAKALASDPSQPPQPAIRLFGFPGPAPDANTTRLWLDLDLTSYVDVPNDAIVHHQTLDNDQGTLLWVEPSAKLSHSTTQSQEVQAKFLGGPIAETNLAASASTSRSAGALNLGGGFQTGFVCPGPNSFAWSPCPPTDLVPCRVTFNIPCITRDWNVCVPQTPGCPTPGCPTGLHCPSQNFCPDTPLCNDPVVNPGEDPVGPFRPRGGGFR